MTLFRSLSARPRSPKVRRSRRSVLLRLEALENRDLPSNLPLTLPTAAPDPATQARVGAAFLQLPLSFEANQGQTAPQVDFLARGPDAALFLTPTGATLSFHSPGTGTDTVLGLELAGARAVHGSGQDLLPGTSNYFVGNDPAQWHSGIANYGQVVYHGVYPGIDLVYRGNQQQLEYDFVVGPWANPGAIRLQFSGEQRLAIDAQGDLVLHTAAGDVVEQAPVVYQEVGAVRQAVAGKFEVEGKGQVGFTVGAYDPSRPLIIDPVLSYSTYLGGSGTSTTIISDSADRIAVDANGNAYITGRTVSTDFPTTPGVFQSQLGSGQNAFVTKLNASGTALVYSTYLGGHDSQGNADVGASIAVDANGNAYITGQTNSTTFPTTTGAIQTQLGGNGALNAFVTKLNASGTQLVYSTYLGGSVTDAGSGIVVDSAGSAYVTGFTQSTNFPTTTGVFQQTDPGSTNAFVTKLNATGTALVYSTYLGGSAADFGNGLAVDGSGNAYVTGITGSADFPTTSGAFQTSPGNAGTTGFVTKLNATGTALVYSTYLGGDTSDFADGIAVDSTGNAYITGKTSSTNFPTTTGAFQTHLGASGAANAFVTKLNTSGSGLVYSTYLGGSNQDLANSIALDSSGNAYVVGDTKSTDFPTAHPIQATYNSTTNGFNALVSKLNADGTSLVFSTYLGGSGNDFGMGIALDGNGNIYVTGATSSSDFPTTSGAFQTHLASNRTNAFVAKIATGSATAGTLQFSAATFSANETDATATITVTRSGGSSGAVSVTVSTGGGTAVAGTDYTATSQTVSWADGETGSKTITVSLLDDMLTGESNETVGLTLSGATGGATLGTQSTGTLNLAEDSDIVATPGMLQFSSATFNANETDPTATITMSRSGGSSGAVSVTVSTGGGTAVAGTDYTATTQTVSWADGETADKTVTIPLLDDMLTGESNETVGLTLSNATGGATLGSQNTATLNIAEDADIPVNHGTLQFSAPMFIANETDATATITVTRTGGSSGAVTATVSTGGGTAVPGIDYTATTRVLSWTDGDTAPKTVTIGLLDDNLIGEGNATGGLTLSGATGGAALGSQSTATLTLAEDNDTAGDHGIIQFSSATFSANETDRTATITVTRSGGGSGAAKTGVYTFGGTAVAGGDYTTTLRVVVWADGETGPKTVTIPLLDDNLPGEDNATVGLILTGARGATLGPQSTATLTLAEDTDTPASHGTLQFSAATFSAHETDPTATITVTRTGGSSGAVSVTVSTGGGTAVPGTEYTSTSQTVSWADGDTAPKTVTIPLLDDNLAGEGNETVGLTLSNATGGSTFGSPSTATLNLAEDTDNASSHGTLQFSAAIFNVSETNATATITLTRNGGSSGAVSVIVSTGGGTAVPGIDYTATTRVISWTDGDTAPRTVTIPLLDDMLTGEDNVTVGLTLSNSTGGATLGSLSTTILVLIEEPATAAAG
jgi:hypothetical protein